MVEILISRSDRREDFWKQKVFWVVLGNSRKSFITFGATNFKWYLSHVQLENSLETNTVVDAFLDIFWNFDKNCSVEHLWKNLKSSKITTKVCPYIKAQTTIKVIFKVSKERDKRKEAFRNQLNNYNGYGVHSGNYDVDFK